MSPAAMSRRFDILLELGRVARALRSARRSDKLLKSPGTFARDHSPAPPKMLWASVVSSHPTSNHTPLVRVTSDPLHLHCADRIDTISRTGGRNRHIATVASFGGCGDSRPWPRTAQFALAKEALPAARSVGVFSYQQHADIVAAETGYTRVAGVNSDGRSRSTTFHACR
jgi:hypothetical protein